jgi:hypothetical protein
MGVYLNDGANPLVFRHVTAPVLAFPYRLDQSSVILPDFPEFMISKPSR